MDDPGCCPGDIAGIAPDGSARWRPIRYLRGNFLYGREFLGDADLQAQCDTWLTDVANPRVHGTTGAVPAVRFVTEDQPALRPPPSRRYQSLIPTPVRLPARPGVPVAVERRALTAYTALTEAPA